MRIRLGINNCFAVKRWPQPQEWASVVRDELGLALVQHSLDLTELREGDSRLQADAIRRASEQAGVVVESVFTGLAAYSMNLMLGPTTAARDDGERFWAKGVSFAARLRAGSFGGHVGSLSRDDASRLERRRELGVELAQRLERLRRQALSEGLGCLLIENMACSREPSSIQGIRALIRDGDGSGAAIRACVDVGHQCVPGSSGRERDPYEWLRALGADAAMVHLQQSDSVADHHWPFTAEYNRLGRIEPARVIEALEQSGAAEATLILEVIPPFEADDDTVLDQLRETVAYWKPWLAAG